MARKPMVTRSVKGTRVTLMALDIETAEPLNITYVVTKHYKNDEVLLKRLKEVHDTDTVKLVAIVAKESVNTLYGMPEDDFMANAIELDPQTRQPYKIPDAEG